MTIDEVAARARVGKSSIYLRWPDKTSLLTDALRRVQLEPDRTSEDGTPGSDVDEPRAVPSLREYLVGHATRRAQLYLSDAGDAMLRLYVEARAHPEVFADIRRRTITDFVLDERRRVEEAVQHVDRMSPASTVQLLDAVEGAIFMHVLVTPPHLVERVRRSLAEYIEQMVDNQLRAVGLSPLGS
jgi:AcrR family transcriptional regulator